MLLPLRDTPQRRGVAYVTGLLILLNLAAFVVEVTGLSRHGEQFVTRWALTPQAALHPTSAAMVAPWVTHMFLHGGLGHLFGNMWFLWAFGGPAEHRLGHRGLLGTYVLSGLGGALLHVLSAPGSATPLLGASGAISGVMGAFLWELGGGRLPLLVFVWRVHVRAWVPVAGWVVLQAVEAFASLEHGAQAAGTAFWAHLGGFVVGLCATAVKARR